MRLRWGILIVALLSWSSAAEAITKTRIQDTLYNADGTLAGGLITVSWKSFTAVDGSSVAANSLVLRITNGVLKTDLTPNPAGTSYTVLYLLDGRTASTETWIVPVSAAPLKLSQVRRAATTAAPAAGGSTIANIYTAGGNTGIGPAVFTPSTTLEIFDATPTTGVTRHILRVGAGQGTTPLLSLHPGTGTNSVGFRVPPLSGSTVYTLPAQDGVPGSYLRTDGTGNLSWSSATSLVVGEFYQTFQNSGLALAQRHNANFRSGLIAVDNPANDSTDVSLGPHAATHATAGTDPVTPGSIGALKNTSDTLNTGAASNIGLVIKGAAGQVASLQEWHDSSDNLLASITATGRVFFPEAFFSARPAETATSLFFQVGGLNRFSMTTFAGAYNFNRYDDLGNFRDTPLQIVRTGHVAFNESVDINNPAAGGATKVTVKAGAAQGAANLQEWQSNAGAVLSSVDASGFYQFPAGQKHGTGTQVQLFTGTTIVDDCAKFDANGNIVSAGGSCGSVRVPVFQDSITPTGTIDGTNAVFALPLAPSPPESLKLTRNGLVQKAGFDFTLSGATVTFAGLAVPQPGDTLLAWYRAGVSPPSSAAGGDLSGTYPNPTVATVGGVTAANVASGANAANAATNLNTPGTIVKRDASGNFSAGTITAALSGNASSATALAATPGQCGANQFATGVAASGNANCAQPAFANLSGTITTAQQGGTAGGDLSGTYPNPGVAKVNGVSYPAGPIANTVPVVTAANTVTYEAVPNAALANSSVTITAGTGLSGGGAASLGGSVTVSMPNVGTAGTYTKVTTDAQGRVSSGTTAAASDLSDGTTGSGSVVLATNPTLSNPSLGAGYLSTTKTAGTTGTAANLLCKINSTGNVVTAATGDVGILGVCVTTQSSGQSVEVATRGIINCVADNAATVGNVAIVGTATGGRCRDSGQSNSTQVSSSTQVVGKILTAVTAGSNVSIQLHGPGHYGSLIDVSNATNKLGLANGGTNADLSGTGGTSQVLKQTSAGAAVTVARLACSDLSNAAASCSADATNAANITSGNLPAAQNTTLVNTADQGYFVGITVFPNQAASVTTAAFTANQAKVWQFVLPFQATIGKITYEVTTASGTCGGTCHMQLALWNADLTTVAVQTGILTSGGSPDINSATVQTKAVTATTLAPGVYNLVMTADSTALILRGVNISSQMINQLNNQSVKKWGTCGNNGAAGALPTSCGTVTAATAVPPQVTFER